MRRLDHEGSRHDRAGKKRRAVADRFDTDDTCMRTCMHTVELLFFFFSKAVETCINLSSLVLLP